MISIETCRPCTWEPYLATITGKEERRRTTVMLPFFLLLPGCRRCPLLSHYMNEVLSVTGNCCNVYGVCVCGANLLIMPCLEGPLCLRHSSHNQSRSTLSTQVAMGDPVSRERVAAVTLLLLQHSDG